MNIVGADLDKTITMSVSRMVPDGTWINTDSLIKAVESFIHSQTMSPTTSQTHNQSPSTVTVVHCLGEPMDGISCSEQSELESLHKENREKRMYWKIKRIEELEAQEQRFTHQIDKLEGDLLNLKARFERYCANMHVGGNNSTTTANLNLGHNSNHPEQQTSASTSTVQQGNTSPQSGVLSQAVIQHFNTLGIDLRNSTFKWRWEIKYLNHSTNFL